MPNHSDNSAAFSEESLHYPGWRVVVIMLALPAYGYLTPSANTPEINSIDKETAIESR